MLFRRIVVLFQLAQAQMRSVMHLHIDCRSSIVIDINLFEVRDEANFVQRLFVILHVLVGLRRSIMIVERHAGRNDIQHHGPLVRDGGFQHGAQLPLVSRERPSDKRCAQLHGQRAGINWR